MLDDFLRETESIDYGNPAIRDKVSKLMWESGSSIEYVERPSAS